MVKQESLQIYLAICLALNLIIHQVNIVGTYLESLLDDNKYPIFMKLLPDIYELYFFWECLSCRLLKSLYGPRQSRQLWNKNIIAFYKSIGFKQLNGNLSILIRQTKKEISFISVYIDNFLLAFNTMNALQALKDKLEKEYEMKDLGKAKTIIG